MTAPSIDFDSIIKKWFEASEQHDAKAFASLLAPDVVYSDMAFKHTFNGQAEAEKWYADFFTAYPDFTVELLGGVLSGNTAAAEWSFTATLRTAFRTVPASLLGKTRTVRGVSVVEFDDAGKIRRLSDYWSLPDLIT